MSKNVVYILRCSRNCELNFVLVHAEASRLQRTGSWLCDDVSKIVLMRELSTVVKLAF